MPSSDTNTLVRAIHEQSKGRIKVISGGKHKKLIYAKDAEGNKAGQAVRDENGPLILSDTPGEHRNRELAVHRLLKARVLQYDPWKPPQGKKSSDSGGGAPPDREEQFEQKVARRLAVADAHRKTNQVTQDLRERVEPMIVKLGGWDKYGFKTELAVTAKAYLDTLNVKNWPSKEAAMQSANLLAKGNTLSVKACGYWSQFFEELEKSFNPQERYFELVRAAKGLRAPAPIALAQRVSSDGDVEQVITQRPDGGGDGGFTLKTSPFEFVTLARLHERTGLKWSMGLTIDEYAELQRAYGFMEAVILRDYGPKGEQALQTISEFLIKMGEARFYSMAGRDEARE